MTDAEGKYSIKGLPPGSYSVSVERVGFATSARVQVALRPDSTPEVKFKLTPTGAILGRVLDHEGDAVEGAGVYAQNSAGNRQPVTATTDHTGRYRIGGLTPGRYRIRVHPQSLQFGPEISTDGHEDARYIATYHPGNPDRKSATRLANTLR